LRQPEKWPFLNTTPTPQEIRQSNSAFLIFSRTMNATKTTYPISAYGLMAKRHWKEFRPKMVKELEEAGKLEEALHEAQERTLDELLDLEAKLEAQGLTKQQACEQAWEMVREKYILLPPEDEG
jgi:hypothetical protein